MKTNIIISIGVVFCLGLAGFLGYLVYTSTVVAAQNVPTVTETPLDPSFLTDKSFTELSSKNINGPLPITVQASDLETGNPFQ